MPDCDVRWQDSNGWLEGFATALGGAVGAGADVGCDVEVGIGFDKFGDAVGTGVNVALIPLEGSMLFGRIGVADGSTCECDSGERNEE